MRAASGYHLSQQIRTPIVAVIPRLPYAEAARLSCLFAVIVEMPVAG